MTERKDVQFINCPRCSLEYRGGSVLFLPCGHLVCSDCFDKHHNKEGDFRNYTKHYICTVCETENKEQTKISAQGLGEVWNGLRESYPFLFRSGRDYLQSFPYDLIYIPDPNTFEGFKCIGCHTLNLRNTDGKEAILSCSHTYCNRCIQIRSQPSEEEDGTETVQCDKCVLTDRFSRGHKKLYYGIISLADLFNEVKTRIIDYKRGLYGDAAVEVTHDADHLGEKLGKEMNEKFDFEQNLKCRECGLQVPKSSTIVCKTCGTAPFTLCAPCFFQKHKTHDSEDFGGYQLRTNCETKRRSVKESVGRYSELFDGILNGLVNDLNGLKQNICEECSCGKSSQSQCSQNLKAVEEEILKIDDAFEALIPNLRQLQHSLNEAMRKAKKCE